MTVEPGLEADDMLQDIRDLPTSSCLAGGRRAHNTRKVIDSSSSSNSVRIHYYTVQFAGKLSVHVFHQPLRCSKRLRQHSGPHVLLNS
jgi:hypothetical protein